MDKPLLDLADEYLNNIDAVFRQVNKGLSILQRTDDLAGELLSPEAPCVQGDDSDEEEGD